MTQGFHIVIPARYASSRLPGKPLTPLAGRPLVEHVWRRAKESGAQTVVVATDDERVASCVDGFGGRACLTRADHASGTDRVAEVAAQHEWRADEVVVNLQGDAPLIEPEHIRAVAARARRDDLATLASPFADPAEAADANRVKVVLNAAGQALYFSRAPIPAHHPTRAGQPRYLRHTGLYAYRFDALRRLTGQPVCELESVEGLEQLRALWLGLSIGVEIVDPPPGPEVDTPEDLRAVERLLGQGLASV